MDRIKRSFSSKRRCGNRRGGDKKGLSHRGRYRCRYGEAHHRGHQRLANCYRPIVDVRYWTKNSGHRGDKQLLDGKLIEVWEQERCIVRLDPAHRTAPTRNPADYAKPFPF